MANQFFDFAKQIFTLTNDVQKNKTDIKELREDLKVTNQKMDRLIEAFQRLTFEFQRDRENAERDRELQRIQLENILLRSERRLPPVSEDGQHHDMGQVEALQRENEELKRRLEQLERDQ